MNILHTLRAIIEAQNSVMPPGRHIKGKSMSVRRMILQFQKAKKYFNPSETQAKERRVRQIEKGQLTVSNGLVI